MKHGFLPRNDNGADAYRWEFGMPAEITVDEGNNEQASREAIKMGMSSKKIEAQKKGYQAKVIRKQRLAEIEENCADAQKLASQYGMTFDRAMELIEQRSPNPVLQPQQQKPSVTTTVTK
jgi:3-hydroxyisobutyrate dehydrogenase-like beta-hydroxyacid dehydrogenase